MQGRPPELTKSVTARWAIPHSGERSWIGRWCLTKTQGYAEVPTVRWVTTLLGYLPALGVAPTMAPAADTVVEATVEAYRRWLIHERGLAADGASVPAAQRLGEPLGGDDIAGPAPEHGDDDALVAARDRQRRTLFDPFDGSEHGELEHGPRGSSRWMAG